MSTRDDAMTLTGPSGGTGPGGDEKSKKGLVKKIATGYTTNVPEPAQLAFPAPTFAARQFDSIPGAGVRLPEEGPTDKANDRRGPIDSVLDGAIERPEGFEDRIDPVGPSVGETVAPGSIPDRQRGPNREPQFDTTEDNNPQAEKWRRWLLIGGVAVGGLYALSQAATISESLG